MKKLFLSLAILALAIVACENNDEVTPNQEAAVDMSDFFVYTPDDVSAKSTKDAPVDKCYSMKVLNRQLQENPGLEQRMFEIEKHTRTLIANKGVTATGKPGGGTTPPPPTPTPYIGAITIPVVINIIESFNGKVTEAQINSQIAILNEDFKNSNPNTSNTPTYFASLVADVDITFTLAAVNRKISSKTSWGTADAMKIAKRGGINPTDPANNLNIWVCEIGGGILGYAQFPGGALATDGVVITTTGFGETTGVYGDGRTATHEIGHWLNLRHIWGDGGCGVDDYVLDTPVAGAPNYGNSDGTCQGTVNSCVEATNDLPDMTMNYMDYVYDNCMYMFTNGQNNRMRTLFGTGGFRESFIN
ncbi:MAG TPA: zinc metalloprotease [Lutibacter sp.]